MKCLVVLLLCLTAGELFASDGGPRFALVIGNSNYDGTSSLANPVNDASDMADALESIGWSVTKVLNGDRKAINRGLVQVRDALLEATNPTVLFFYAGHGVQIQGENYLIPLGESFQSADDVLQDAIPLQNVYKSFSDGGAVTQIVILDACRDNPFGRTATRSLGAQRGLSIVGRPPSAEGSAVMFATAPGETAADGVGRNGVFTLALLKYLKSDLKLQDLVTRVSAEVRERTGGKQVPFNSLSLSADFYLVPESLRTSETPTQPVKFLTNPTAEPRQKSFPFFTFVGASSLLVSAGGAVTAGVGAVGGSLELSEYQQETDRAKLTSLRNSINDKNQLYKTGVVIAVSGVVSATISWIVAWFIGEAL